MRRFAAALAAGAFSAAAAAQETPRWYLRVDNDFFMNTDRWYSSGVRLARVTPREGGAIEWALQQDIYSPDAKGFELGTVDREPAARLYGAVALHDRTHRRHVTFEGALGVLGPAALGEEVTDVFHAIVPARDVNWDRQGDNRVEAQLAYARTDFLDGFHVHHGAVAGTTHVFAHAGVEVRFGDPHLATISSPLMRFAPTPPWNGARGAGWSGFVGLSARYVARNAVLGEPYDPLSARVEREKVVGRAVGGAAWQRPWGSVVLALAVETREFTAQGDPHAFGSLSVHVPF